MATRCSWRRSPPRSTNSPATSRSRPRCRRCSPARLDAPRREGEAHAAARLGDRPVVLRAGPASRLGRRGPLDLAPHARAQRADRRDRPDAPSASTRSATASRRTRPTARSCCGGDASCTGASARSSRSCTRTGSRSPHRCWRTTSARAATTSARSAYATRGRRRRRPRLYANAEAVTHCDDRAIEAAIAARSDRRGAPATCIRCRGRALELAGRFEEAVGNYEAMEGRRGASGARVAALAADLALTTLYATPTPVFDAVAGRELCERTIALARELNDRSAEIQGAVEPDDPERLQRRAIRSRPSTPARRSSRSRASWTPRSRWPSR